MDREQKDKIEAIINRNLDGDDPLSASWVTDDGIEELCEYIETLWQVKEKSK